MLLFSVFVFLNLRWRRTCQPVPGFIEGTACKICSLPVILCEVHCLRSLHNKLIGLSNAAKRGYSHGPYYFLLMIIVRQTAAAYCLVENGRG